MRELPGPWAARVSALRAQTWVEAPAFYYDLLALRAASVDIWQTTYEHVMPNAESIVEWVKGTGLWPYFESLAENAWWRGAEPSHRARQKPALLREARLHSKQRKHSP